MESRAPLPEQLNAREHEILSRLARGLSDQQIADELFLSLNTVKWYNRQIYSKLGVGSRTQAIAQAKAHGWLESGAVRAPLAATPQLPLPSTPFIGRRREIDDVKQLLDRSRLLTLHGTGGTGKTRLALQVASEVADAFADGVCFVDLAPLSDPKLVEKAIARALGVGENPSEPLLNTLKRALARRALLLLIDNFEHVIQAAPVVSELLAASPSLKILVTSREALRLTGEQEYLVPPLSLPASGEVSVDALVESEAGTLFVQRARMTLPRFAASDTNAPAIAQICSRLDGLPLAIELAAARCKLLTPQSLLERLAASGESSPFQVLAGGSRDAPPRQRTLRDTVTWSYNLLDEDEKTLFARLSVFQGGRSLEAIEAVCADGLTIDVFDGLASLVDKNLVQQKVTPEGEPRFILLEMIHEYARERLEASGEAEAMRQRHADYFVTLAERAEPELRLAGYEDWCRRFDLEVDNFRTVLEWSLNGGNLALGVRLASALGQYWYGQGKHIEGLDWTNRLLERLDDVPVEYQAKFLIIAGHMAWMVDLDAATALFQRAHAVSRKLEDQEQTAWALACLGYAMQREPNAAMPIAEEGLAIFESLGHLPGIAQTLNIIGEIARLGGDDARARHAYEHCLAVCHTTGEARRICYMCINLAYVAQHECDHARALELGRQALQIARERPLANNIVEALAILAGSFGSTGEPERAARLMGAVDAALERMGSIHQPSDQPEIDRMIAEVRAQLGEAAFQTAYTEGRRMSLDDAVADALGESRSPRHGFSR